MLSVQERFPESTQDKAFVEGLRENGYIVGENIVIEVRSAAGRLERLSELPAELVKLKCDAIVVHNTAGPGGAEGDNDDPHCYGGCG